MANLDRIEQMVDDALAAGASLLCGHLRSSSFKRLLREKRRSEPSLIRWRSLLKQAYRDSLPVEADHYRLGGQGAQHRPLEPVTSYVGHPGFSSTLALFIPCAIRAIAERLERKWCRIGKVILTNLSGHGTPPAQDVVICKGMVDEALIEAGTHDGKFTVERREGGACAAARQCSVAI